MTNNTTTARETIVRGTPWHCPYCDRKNYEPAGKYEDGFNVKEMIPFEDADKDTDIISFFFECPHCKRKYKELYRATYLDTIGEKGTFESPSCQQCGADREPYTPMDSDWWWFFNTDGELGIDVECAECGEVQTDWYKIKYVAHIEYDR